MRLELLPQIHGHILVEHARHLVVDVQLHGVGFVDVHGQCHPFHHVDVVRALHSFLGVGVLEVLFAVAEVFYDILLEYG